MQKNWRKKWSFGNTLCTLYVQGTNIHLYEIERIINKNILVCYSEQNKNELHYDISTNGVVVVITWNQLYRFIHVGFYS